MAIEAFPLARWLVQAARRGQWVAFATPLDRWRAGQGGLEVLDREGRGWPVPMSWMGRSGPEGPLPGRSSFPAAGRPWLVLAPVQDEPGNLEDEGSLTVAQVHDALARPGGGQPWPEDPARAVRRGDLVLEDWLEGWGLPAARHRPWRGHSGRLGSLLLAGGHVTQLDLKQGMARQVEEDLPLGQLLRVPAATIEAILRGQSPRPPVADPLAHPWLVTALWGLVPWADVARAWHEGGYAGLDRGWATQSVVPALRARAEAHARVLREADAAPRLGSLLVRRGLAKEVLADALARQVDQAMPLGHLLVAAGRLELLELVAALEEQRMERRLAAWDRVPPPAPPPRPARSAPTGHPPPVSKARRRRRLPWLLGGLSATSILAAALWRLGGDGASDADPIRPTPGGATWLGGAKGLPLPPIGREGRPEALDRAVMSGRPSRGATFSEFPGSGATFEGRQGLEEASAMASSQTLSGIPSTESVTARFTGLPSNVGERQQALRLQAEPSTGGPPSWVPGQVRGKGPAGGLAERELSGKVSAKALPRDTSQDLSSSGTTQRTGEWLSEPLGEHDLQDPTEALQKGATRARLSETAGTEGVRAAQAMFRTRLGLTALRSGDVATAREAFEAAVREDPILALPHWHLAELARARGDTVTARRHLQEVVRLAPESEEGVRSKSLLER
ncbi:MAG: hypothetical protein VKO21_05450 [Candidatus Sericytochromatia bacterium]|nr:hypothetical protein [Candidatus Sericytochromatia bacterium]